MLMAGMLMTEQVSSSNLLNLSVIQLDKDMQNQSYQLIAEAKAASPKAIRLLSQNLQIIPSVIKSKCQSECKKSKTTKVREIFTKKLGKSTKSNSSQGLINEFYKRKTLTAKQRRDRLVFTRNQKASFINTQNLVIEPNSNDIVVASSQSFINQKLPNLGFSSSGVAVRVLQRLLVVNGYAIKVDGSFGALTETAVKAFQAQQDLTSDGIVGMQTWNYLTIYSKQGQI